MGSLRSIVSNIARIQHFREGTVAIFSEIIFLLWLSPSNTYTQERKKEYRIDSALCCCQSISGSSRFRTGNRLLPMKVHFQKWTFEKIEFTKKSRTDGARRAVSYELTVCKAPV